MPKRKPIDSKRRSPLRAGSQETVAVIFEATARILQTHGRGGLNTNLIAEKAGVSVGTIYGYFSNKETILLEMARRELDAIRDRVAQALMETNGAEPDPARRAIRALIQGYGKRSKVRRILMETLFAHGGSEEMARPVYEIAEVLSANRVQLLPPDAKPLSPIGMYVLTRAVDAVVRAATYEDAGFIGTPEFEDEMVRLIYGYLGAP